MNIGLSLYHLNMTLKIQDNVIFGLVGAGGFAREVIHLIRNGLNLPLENVKVCFVESEIQNKLVNGVPVISVQEFINYPAEKKYFSVAISNSHVRQRLSTEFHNSGARIFSLRSTSSFVDSTVAIGEGYIICQQSLITANSKIGNSFHLNVNSYVAHDCVIGDFVTFAPNVSCHGNVEIGNHAYVGAGALIRQGSKSNPLRIGEHSIIGMGSVVLKDVEPFTVVAGNPAKVIRRLVERDES
jgi:sugar O-acyltransferase (sialic acid O-acetyltransferase NeuD family)